MEEDTGKMKRREFLAGLGAAATIGTALTQIGPRADAQGPAAPTMVPSPDIPSAMVPVNWAGPAAAPAAPEGIPALAQAPNILVIVVDQMRQPLWLDAAHLPNYWASIPNILSIHQRAVTFDQYYSAATVCTPARGCLLTGIYAPQTAMYVTSQVNPPALDPRYPTWGNAIQKLNPAYNGNVWWFGKWHLSAEFGGSLAPYGFQTVTYPSATNPSPNGVANEGSNGTLFSCQPSSYAFYNRTLASDAQIVQDFAGWLNTNPSGPWCATVSLINPHDIAFFPYWLAQYTGGCQQASQTGYGTEAYFNPPGAPPNPLYSSVPSPWNYESVASGSGNYKPPLQQLLINGLDKVFNSGNPLTYPTDFVTLLNYYYYLQTLVDARVGDVLNALTQHSLTSNTIIVFTADHGEYGGSHSMRDKGGAVYDESIRVPLYIAFRNLTTNYPRDQMCSAVDFFGLMCDLATGGSGAWRSTYPDLANRESIYDFAVNNSLESHRTVTINVAGTQKAVPYILHTTDEGKAGVAADAQWYADLAAPSAPTNHVVCIRTKTTNGGNSGFKYAVYSNWASCTTYPSSSTSYYEYYDYQDSMGNRVELGNNYYLNSPLMPRAANTDPQSLLTLSNLETQLGTWGSPDGGTGKIGSELNATLVGTGTDGTSLRCVLLETARPAYFTWLGQTTCTVPSCT